MVTVRALYGRPSEQYIYDELKRFKKQAGVIMPKIKNEAILKSKRITEARKFICQLKQKPIPKQDAKLPPTPLPVVSGPPPEKIQSNVDAFANTRVKSKSATLTNIIVGWAYRNGPKARADSALVSHIRMSASRKALAVGATKQMSRFINRIRPFAQRVKNNFASEKCIQRYMKHVCLQKQENLLVDKHSHAMNAKLKSIPECVSVSKFMNPCEYREISTQMSVCHYMKCNYFQNTDKEIALLKCMSRENSVNCAASIDISTQQKMHHLLQQPQFKRKMAVVYSKKITGTILDALVRRLRKQEEQFNLLRSRRCTVNKCRQNGHVGRKNLRVRSIGIVPTAPGMKYCRMCNSLLSLDKFPRSCSRYTCKKCWGRNARLNKVQRYAKDPFDFDGEFMRVRILHDARVFFQTHTTPFRVLDTKRICAKLKLSVSYWRFMPRDPLKQCSVMNYVIVSRPARTLLIDAWKKGNRHNPFCPIHCMDPVFNVTYMSTSSLLGQDYTHHSSIPKSCWNSSQRKISMILIVSDTIIMEGLFRDMQGFTFPNTEMNRGPLPSMGGSSEFQTPDGLINATDNLLSGVNPYSYGENPVSSTPISRPSTQTSYINHPHRIQKVIPKIFVPAASSDTNTHDIPLEHALHDGDLTFTLRMPKEMICGPSEFCQARNIPGRALAQLINLSTVNYLLWGLQNGRNGPDKRHNRWQNFFLRLTQGALNFNHDMESVSQIWFFLQTYIRPFGVMVGSDMQGGQHEGGNARIATYPVDYVGSFLIDGKCIKLNNLWRHSNVAAGDDVALVLRKTSMHEKSRVHVLTSGSRAFREETTFSPKPWYYLAPEIVKNDTYEHPYIHIGRAQSMHSAYNAGMGMGRSPWDARASIVGQGIQVTFSPVFVTPTTEIEIATLGLGEIPEGKPGNDDGASKTLDDGTQKKKRKKSKHPTTDQFIPGFDN